MPYGYPPMPPQEEEQRPPMPMMPPQGGPVPPGVSAEAMGPPPPPQGMPPQAQNAPLQPPPGVRPAPTATSQNQPSLISRLLPTLGAGAIAGVGMALGGDVGQAMGGLAQGFADQKLKMGTELRAQKFKQNEALLQQAHKAVMDTMGKDLSGFPNLAKLVDKYNTAITSQESDGNYISPKEASEIIALWTVAQGELSQANAQQEETGMRRKAGVERSIAQEGKIEDERFLFGGSPEEAQGRLRAQAQQARSMEAPVDAGSLGIDGLPSGLMLPRSALPPLLSNELTSRRQAETQRAITDRVGAQQLAQLQKQYELQDATARRMAIVTLADRLLTPSPIDGSRLANSMQEATAMALQFLDAAGNAMTPIPGSRRGRVTPGSVHPVE